MYKLLPPVISVLALIAVLAVADLDAFKGLSERAQWDRLPLIALLVCAIVFAFGWRWHTLLHETLPMRRSILITALGLGGNQVLPLRGGDALRVLLSARGPGAPSVHAGVSALAMEKLIDLVAVAAFGLAATVLVVSAAGEYSQVNVVAIASAILAGAAVLLLAARSGLMITAFQRFARLIRIPVRLYRHLLRPLHHLRESVTAGRMAWLFIETAVIWVMLYLPAYWAIAHLVGITLGAGEVMTLMFAGALGIAIPAAPSGIGTFHAAIVSAFVLLGKPASEGLVLAVAIHGVFFIGSFCRGRSRYGDRIT